VHIDDRRVIALVAVDGVLRTGKKFALTAYTVGVPEYADGAFYFKTQDVEVQKFAYEGSTPTELFSTFARRYVSDEKLRQLVEDRAPRLEKWMTATAQDAAIRALEHIPMYRPKDDVKGLLIRASLDSVKIDQDRIVLTFTLWKLTITVLLGTILFAAAIGAMLALLSGPILRFVVLSRLIRGYRPP
jgi:hypothetical protein